MLGDIINETIDEITHAFYALIGVAFSLGALAVWGIPKLWAFAKPIIHAWTA